MNKTLQNLKILPNNLGQDKNLKLGLLVNFLARAGFQKIFKKYLEITLYIKKVRFFANAIFIQIGRNQPFQEAFY